LKAALLRLNPAIDVLRIGDPGAPATGAMDAEVLAFAELSGRLLVTADRRSMPGHLDAHVKAGGRVWGLLWVRDGTPVSLIARELALVWEATEAEEWVDVLEWIPM
jgi:hypothetical protein